MPFARVPLSKWPWGHDWRLAPNEWKINSISSLATANAAQSIANIVLENLHKQNL